MTGLSLLPSPEGADAWPALLKPAGRPVTGHEGVLAEARASLGEGLALVHRLDRETSGVLLLARTREALVLAHAAWSRDVTKTYLARTRGVPEPREGVVDAPLLENRTSRPDLLRRALKAAYGAAAAGQLLSGRRFRDLPPIPQPGRTAAHPAGRPSSTAYRVVEADAEGLTALVELKPREGRMHQIRVHLLELGTPLLHDRLYDVGADRAREPFLHAWRLEWRDPPGREAGTTWAWEAPLPRGPER